MEALKIFVFIHVKMWKIKIFLKTEITEILIIESIFYSCSCILDYFKVINILIYMEK